MAKFEVLQNNRRLISLACGIDIKPKSKLTESTRNSFTSFRVHTILFVVVNMMLSFSVKTFTKSYDFTARLTAASIVIALCQAFIIFLNMAMKIQQFTALIHTFQAIVDGEAQNDKDDIHGIYWRAEQKCRKFVKVITTAIFGYDQITYVVYFIYAIYCCGIGNYDTTTWPVLLEVSVPFDTTTVFGWYLQLFMLISMDIAYLLCFLLAATQFIGCCIYVAAICEHFDAIMQTIQANVEQNLREKNRLEFEKCNTKIVEKYREAIQIHVEINDIFDIVADINSASIFALLVPNALVLGIFMYQIHQVAAVFDIGGVFFFLMTLVLILVWPYLFCYYADSATDRISNIQRSVYNLNWYSFPPEQQKHLILIMAQSQRTVCFTGLNLIRCKLISFGMLVKSSISYYLAFDVISSRV